MFARRGARVSSVAGTDCARRRNAEATHDAMVPSCLQDLLDDGALLGASVSEPATKGEDRNLKTGGTQVPELHVLGVVGGADGRLSHVCG